MEIKGDTLARMCEMNAGSIEALSYDDVFIGYVPTTIKKARGVFKSHLFNGALKDKSSLTKYFVLKGLVYIYACEHKKRAANE